MRVISVLSYKGGVGKSTVATNLASGLSSGGAKVALIDLDQQKSSENWLRLRGGSGNKVNQYKKDEDFDYVVVDTPSGIDDEMLKKVTSMSNKMLVPIKPGTFDIMSVKVFLMNLVKEINQSEYFIDVALLPNMVVDGTSNTDTLLDFVNKVGINKVSTIKDSHLYPLLAAYGLSVFDSDGKVHVEPKEDWLSVIEWAKEVE